MPRRRGTIWLALANFHLLDYANYSFMSITFFGLLIPFLGTILGSACVFFMKREMNDSVQWSLLGFAAGFALMMVLDVALG